VKPPVFGDDVPVKATDRVTAPSESAGTMDRRLTAPEMTTSGRLPQRVLDCI